MITPPYKPKNHIRIVTATSLFDGHDAAINVMRRIIQATGVEVIHLGHDRSVQEIVDCAIQEDVQGIAISSYQGGHMEYFKYMYDLLQERGGSHVKIFGGGGGVILPHEIEELQTYGIARIYSPDDGRAMGLQGMINDMVQKLDFPLGQNLTIEAKDIHSGNPQAIARLITAVENFPQIAKKLLSTISHECSLNQTPVVGITGTGGSGKSSVTDEILRRLLIDFPEKHIAIISVDPTRKRSGGALLGDRIRMNSVYHPNVYMRSLATRQANVALSKHIKDVLCIIKNAGFDLVLLETSGIGQSDSQVMEHSDLALYVMTPEFGAPTQLEKIDMLDFADMVVLNKADRPGAADALSHVRKQYLRNRQLFDSDPASLPIFPTIASRFNDPGVNRMYAALIKMIGERTNQVFSAQIHSTEEPVNFLGIIPASRMRYLSEIAETVRNYNKWSEEQAALAQECYALQLSIESAKKEKNPETNLLGALQRRMKQLKEQLEHDNLGLIESWEERAKSYRKKFYEYTVRGKAIRVETHAETLSHLQVPKIALPAYTAWGDLLKWQLRENFPGEFPFAAGVFPFKREAEDPIRMFAGEGAPERTNKRFHYLSRGLPARRLSTAFDSVTLYGRDPGERPDIYGKIGNSGVSVCCLDDAKKLYSGFNLTNPSTSVSMTINGPAPAMVGFFMNAAIDQQCELYIKEHGLTGQVEKKINKIFKAKLAGRPSYNGPLPEGNDGLGLMLLGVTGDQVLPAEVYEKIKVDTLSALRGTVQADILKEDQAQNTCIFSTEFALRMMGDIQEYFIRNKVRNFYSVSISGYHIAEAGANPITQLAFTLANGFTYLEYYRSRGMKVNDFAPNFSFFFSNGLDAEYTVIGRVARLIWAKAMKHLYKASDRSQKLKYHIQTSGRSLHAQEIEFNDIRTTLQGLGAIYDNCNSLHTNAYDEAITTPTEDSVRRAVAIQMIINHELGLARNQNPLQGSFIIEELTNLVEEAVLQEFDRLAGRGGVLGAMETMYQRNKIQEESSYYEHLKHSGELPIMGVNTFLSASGSPTIIPGEVIRATEHEKQQQIATLHSLHQRNAGLAQSSLNALKKVAIHNQNTFDALMVATKYCSLGQITEALFEVGGQYRRNM
ncbi:MAG: methylmalonyl-CoA mutase family protein [Bacteroidales bacterium]|nr:methylmalonyl-CoA mutase family protein [Bacteroidales bacterium]MDZ4203421.1 methylmalonyl-CoA mutase family protein [Bacteroidales bacterium]